MVVITLIIPILLHHMYLYRLYFNSIFFLKVRTTQRSRREIRNLLKKIILQNASMNNINESNIRINLHSFVIMGSLFVTSSRKKKTAYLSRSPYCITYICRSYPYGDRSFLFVFSQCL